MPSEHDRRPHAAGAPQAAPGLRLARGVLRRLRRDVDRLADERAAPRRRTRARQAAEAQARLPRPARLRRRHQGRSPPTRSARRRATTPPTPPPCTAIRPTRTGSTATRGATARAGCGSSTGSSTTTTTSSWPARSSAAASTRATGSSCSSASAPSEQPEQAVFSQHKTAESKAWANVRKATNSPATPLVYVARGSHANYFSAGLALDRRVVRPGRRQGPADRAHARGPRRHRARVGAVAGRLGRHEADQLAAGLLEPDQPGPAPALARPRPAQGARRRSRRRPRPHRPGRRCSAPTRTSCSTYEAPPEATTLVVALRRTAPTSPPSRRRSRSTGQSGKLELPARDRDYDVWTSVVGPDGAASEGVKAP